ncbi:MAG: RusA family crossover junction endodeoxyribonuclease [Nitrospinota bacterium]|nr:RusA family crossover junction endodeoxyribonuclease [Nitrospinota bacterium]
MKRSIKFSIPGDPVAQGRPRFSRAHRVQVYDPPRSRVWKRSAGLVARQMMNGAEPMEGALFLRVVIHLARPKSAPDRTVPMVKPDLSNYIKAIEDALSGIVFRDDALIVEISAKKVYSLTPQVSVEVIPL